ncbi:MAG: F0F1 ATP synthase subunit A [Atopostipes sp.]|nr:F0F1 ATP synthase subunit A [Atopostipes sp.]
MFQEEQLSIIIITAILGLAFWKIGQVLSNLDPDEKPNRLVAAVIAYVKFIRDYTISSMGKRYGKVFSAYIGSVFIYLLVSNTSGLFGLTAPTTNLSVTLLLALITFVSIQVVKFRENGVGGYFKSYIEPMPLFLIPNVFSEISPLISLSLRLFGNILSGSVIMSLLYMFTGWLSDFIPVIGGFDFAGVVLAPALHLYFDLFAGFLQAFLFISLSIIFIGMEAPRENE